MRRYAIPPSHADRMKNLAAGFFADSANVCREFLRHKMSVISPAVLREYSIPCYRMVHRAGEFMVTFPRTSPCSW